MIRKLFIIAGIVALSPLAFACTEHERVSYTEEAPDNTPINTSYENESSLPAQYETTDTAVQPDVYYSNGRWYYSRDLSSIQLSDEGARQRQIARRGGEGY